jgi:hypothetical protein
MRRELLERGFGQFGKNKSAFLPPQRKDASPLEIGERVNRLNPSMLAVLVQMLRMGTHCLVKEFHPEFHVEVIRRPHTCVLAQLVPYDVILLQHGRFVVEPRHFLRNRVHQIGDGSCFFTHDDFLRFCIWPWLAKYSLEDYVKKTNRKRFYINDF